ncbi:MAG: hypothetical protein MZU95_05050 [Desulfomicrobium escambiense]|nr:hypothetical protein [Desulfomicrobium escambiense]
MTNGIIAYEAGDRGRRMIMTAGGPVFEETGDSQWMAPLLTEEAVSAVTSATARLEELFEGPATWNGR